MAFNVFGGTLSLYTTTTCHFGFISVVIVNDKFKLRFKIASFHF